MRLGDDGASLPTSRELQPLLGALEGLWNVSHTSHQPEGFIWVLAEFFIWVLAVHPVFLLPKNIACHATNLNFFLVEPH